MSRLSSGIRHFVLIHDLTNQRRPGLRAARTRRLALLALGGLRLPGEAPPPGLPTPGAWPGESIEEKSGKNAEMGQEHSLLGLAGEAAILPEPVQGSGRDHQSGNQRGGAE